MKAVILAGGYGTRLGEGPAVSPKPMAEIGGRPILWHILKIYSTYGVTDFIICSGYKSSIIKDYFANYALRESHVTFDLKRGDVEVHRYLGEPWRVTVLETGEATMTGGRIKRARDYLNEETFLLTYGDNVADIDILALINFHRLQGRSATVTAVRRPGCFGALALTYGRDRVSSFHERSRADNQPDWINGGFFVLEPAIFDYIDSDGTVWEREPLENLARGGMLSSFCHEGFWHPLDTPGDRQVLEDLWRHGNAPWKCW